MSEIFRVMNDMGTYGMGILWLKTFGLFCRIILCLVIGRNDFQIFTLINVMFSVLLQVFLGFNISFYYVKQLDFLNLIVFFSKVIWKQTPR